MDRNRFHRLLGALACVLVLGLGVIFLTVDRGSPYRDRVGSTFKMGSSMVSHGGRSLRWSWGSRSSTASVGMGWGRYGAIRTALLVGAGVTVVVAPLLLLAGPLGRGSGQRDAGPTGPVRVEIRPGRDGFWQGVDDRDADY